MSQPIFFRLMDFINNPKYNPYSDSYIEILNEFGLNINDLNQEILDKEKLKTESDNQKKRFFYQNNEKNYKYSELTDDENKILMAYIQNENINPITGKNFTIDEIISLSYYHHHVRYYTRFIKKHKDNRTNIFNFPCEYAFKTKQFLDLDED